MTRLSTRAAGQTVRTTGRHFLSCASASTLHGTLPCSRSTSTILRKLWRTGANPITEKYARMMQSTAPEEYAKIEGQLPELEADSVRICNAVCEIQVGWMEDFAREYPVLASNARAIHTYEDTEWSTSYETYLRGELLTYSRTMLRMYSEHIVAIARENRNLAKMTMENTVRLYGYTSLDEAERES